MKNIYLTGRRWVPSLNTQCFQNSVENVEWSVLTPSSGYLPCCVRIQREADADEADASCCISICSVLTLSLQGHSAYRAMGGIQRYMKLKEKQNNL